jgi:16S rRNA (uracil1498-N3)-methyltransferase
MHVFYVPVLGEDIITLSEEESKHAIRVLRLKKGELVHLADGKGTQCISSIADDNGKKNAHFRLRNVLTTNHVQPIYM